MNILVLYNSQRGHTHAAAKAIAQTVDNLSHQAVVKRIVDASPADVDAADALFIGTWVHGLILFGVEPAGAEQWVPSLPPLEGKPVGVFCTYAFHPRRSLQTLTGMLAQRGAHVVGRRAFHRSRPGSGAERFIESVLQSAQPSPG